jgi:hypothetical protein
MREINGFRKYMKYNLITDQNLRDAIPHFKKKIFQEGQYIYDDMNFGCFFYILLKGKICIMNNQIKKRLFERKESKKFFQTDLISKRKKIFNFINNNIL